MQSDISAAMIGMLSVAMSILVGSLFIALPALLLLLLFYFVVTGFRLFVKVSYSIAVHARQFMLITLTSRPYSGAGHSVIIYTV